MNANGSKRKRKRKRKINEKEIVGYTDNILTSAFE
jgi:hypothetical protein